MENWDFVFDGVEKGVEAQEIGVLDPLIPVGVAGGGATSANSTLHVLRSSAKIVAESIGDVGRTIFQDADCG